MSFVVLPSSAAEPGLVKVWHVTQIEKSFSFLKNPNDPNISSENFVARAQSLCSSLADVVSKILGAVSKLDFSKPEDRKIFSTMLGVEPESESNMVQCELCKIHYSLGNEVVTNHMDDYLTENPNADQDKLRYLCGNHELDNFIVFTGHQQQTMPVTTLVESVPEGHGWFNGKYYIVEGGLFASLFHPSDLRSDFCVCKCELRKITEDDVQVTPSYAPAPKFLYFTVDSKNPKAGHSAILNAGFPFIAPGTPMDFLEPTLAPGYTMENEPGGKEGFLSACSWEESLIVDSLMPTGLFAPDSVWLPFVVSTKSGPRRISWTPDYENEKHGYLYVYPHQLDTARPLVRFMRKVLDPAVMGLVGYKHRTEEDEIKDVIVNSYHYMVVKDGNIFWVNNPPHLVRYATVEEATASRINYWREMMMCHTPDTRVTWPEGVEVDNSRLAIKLYAEMKIALNGADIAAILRALHNVELYNTCVAPGKQPMMYQGKPLARKQPFGVNAPRAGKTLAKEEEEEEEEEEEIPDHVSKKRPRAHVDDDDEEEHEEDDELFGPFEK